MHVSYLAAQQEGGGLLLFLWIKESCPTMCESETAICPRSPLLPKISNAYIYICTHTQRRMYVHKHSSIKRNSGVELYSQYSRPICLNRSAVWALSLRASMGIQNRVQLFTLAQPPPHSPPSLTFRGLATWARCDASASACLRDSHSCATKPTNLCWDPHKADRLVDSSRLEWVHRFPWRFKVTGSCYGLMSENFEGRLRGCGGTGHFRSAGFSSFHFRSVHFKMLHAGKHVLLNDACRAKWIDVLYNTVFDKTTGHLSTIYHTQIIRHSLRALTGSVQSNPSWLLSTH